jgi:tRNA-splicing ligase RtcB (3'-phosphate/5'-hydroxy nucleic acid ligase)
MFIEHNGEMRVHAKIYQEPDAIEKGALDQMRNMAKLPFTFHHVALMPDAHQGYGMPIGGVLATDNVIIPNAVGKDIGCSMSAMKLDLHPEQLTPPIRAKLDALIREAIPTGFHHHAERQAESEMPATNYQELFIVKQQYESALKQVGTLGGGNHFIELQKDDNNNVWIMVHSGSRNLGLKVADHYNHVAEQLNERYFSSVPKEWQLAFLPIGSREAGQYIEEMKYCVEFAKASHMLMQARILYAMESVFSPIGHQVPLYCSHNFARIENHFGHNVWIHRKGATSAQEDEIGIIPGSQATCSYIVKGKGNPDSFKSCSHGAGRKLGRKQAKRTLDLAVEQKRLDDQGITHSLKTIDDLDEAGGAYKDINQVMSQQTDLVEIIAKLKPLLVIKDRDEKNETDLSYRSTAATDAESAIGRDQL